MGPRGHGLPGQAKAQDYIREHLRAQGATVRELSFFYKGSKDAKESRFLNIVGSYGDRPKGFVIIGSHYDTRLWADEDPDPSKHETPILGANDGGSGTAVLLELATVLHERRPPIGIELVFFDGEDYGRKGSSDYFVGSKDMLARFDTLYGGDRPACVVVIDMVGDKDLRFLREGNSSAQVPWLNQRIWNAGQAMFPDAFAPTGSLGVTDDHTAFLEKGIAATLLIDFTYPPWHTSQDTLDKCSPESLAVAGKTLLTAFLDEPFN
jgi:Zn-dependent M28 family amino/carboxypeptidase